MKIEGNNAQEYTENTSVEQEKEDANNNNSESSELQNQLMSRLQSLEVSFAGFADERLGAVEQLNKSIEREKTFITLLVSIFSIVLILLGLFGAYSLTGIKGEVEGEVDKQVESQVNNKIEDIFLRKFEIYAEKANYKVLDEVKSQMTIKITDVDNILGKLTESQEKFKNKANTTIGEIESQAGILRNSIEQANKAITENKASEALVKVNSVRESINNIVRDIKKLDIRKQIKMENTEHGQLYKLGSIGIETGIIHMTDESNNVDVRFMDSFKETPNVNATALSSVEHDYGYTILRNISKSGFSCEILDKLTTGTRYLARRGGAFSYVAIGRID